MRKTPAQRQADEAIERAALLAAQERFLQWRRDWRDVPRADRRAFNGLHSAIVDVQLALGRFDPAAPSTSQEAANLVQLLRLMQDNQVVLRPQAFYRDMFSTLIKLLGLLGTAAAAGGGRGAQPSIEAHAWIWMAADQWASTLKEQQQPSAAERGRFWQALQGLQEDRQARARALPTVSRDVVRAALLEWKALRQVRQKMQD